MFDQVLCAGSRQRRDRASTNRHHLPLILRLWLLLAPLALILSPSALASPLILAKVDVSKDVVKMEPCLTSTAVVVKVLPSR